jgi:hypothetical protein
MASIRVSPKHLETVNTKLKYSVFQNNKTALANALLIGRESVSKYFNGHPIDRSYFEEISEKLGLNWEEIADVEAPPEDPYYIEPPIASECYQEILKPGCLIRIKAPWQMGKTSLMSGALNYAQKRGYRTVALNFREAIADELQNLEGVLQWFCLSVANTLGVNASVEEHWRKSLGNPKIKCKEYLQKYCLSGEQPLALALDELDRLFPYPPIADEVLGMLRTWHEQAKNRQILKQLRLVLVHTELYALPIHQSPFNVGKDIQLPELTEEEVQELLKQYNLNLEQREIQQLREVLGGHPYQVRTVCDRLKQGNITLSEILTDCTTEAGMFSDHLQRFCQKLKEQPELSETLSQVVKAENPMPLSEVNRDRALQLRDLGLVKIQQDQVMPSCELYRRYFRQRLQ